VRLDSNAVHKGLNINLDPRVNYEQIDSSGKKVVLVDSNNPMSKLFS
jgi:hypothetical protein